MCEVKGQLGEINTEEKISDIQYFFGQGLFLTSVLK